MLKNACRGLLLLLCTFSTPNSALARAEPLRALLLTTPGVYHNYERQNGVLTSALAQRMNITFDISLAEDGRWQDEDYGAGYDVIIYNICMADNKNAALIANMRRQTEELGTPAVVIHCTMHSFRETGHWWPFLGLKSQHHDPLGPMHIEKTAQHPVLAGIPDTWSLPEDELYVNMAFGGEALLAATGEDGQQHIVAWLQGAGAAAVFGTTLGHSDDTMANPVFQQLVANGVLFVTGNLDESGQANPQFAPLASPGEVIRRFSAPEGVVYLGDDGLACVYRQFAIAVGPCYAGCVLNPFVWGEQADTCRRTCHHKLPTTGEATRSCMPNS